MPFKKFGWLHLLFFICSIYVQIWTVEALNLLINHEYINGKLFSNIVIISVHQEATLVIQDYFLFDVDQQEQTVR